MSNTKISTIDEALIKLINNDNNDLIGYNFISVLINNGIVPSLEVLNALADNCNSDNYDAVSLLLDHIKPDSETLRLLMKSQMFTANNYGDKEFLEVFDKIINCDIQVDDKCVAQAIRGYDNYILEKVLSLYSPSPDELFLQCCKEDPLAAEGMLNERDDIPIEILKKGYKLMEAPHIKYKIKEHIFNKIMDN